MSRTTGERGEAPGRWPAARLGALVAAAGLLGCGGRAAEAPELGPPPAPSAEAGASSARDAALAKAYPTFTYETCARDVDDCPAALARAAGAELGGSYNPRRTAPNPDPSFLPEWTKLPTGPSSGRYAWQALALAAVQRTWLARCDEAFAGWSKRMDEQLDALDKAVVRASREPNPYDRIAALLAVEPPKPKKGATFEFSPGSDPLRWAWEVAQFQAFEDTKRTFVYVFDGYAPSDELLGAMHARQPRDYEHDAFCLEASLGRVEGVPPLPDTSRWDAEVRGMVRLAISPERRADVERRRSELVGVARARFAKAKAPNPQLPPGVREFSLGSVQKFVRDGRSAVVTVVQTREEQKTTPEGKPRTVKIDETSTATFSDWPSGVVLDPGDTVSFYGAETALKDTVIKSTPELEHLSRQTTLEGKHVTKVVVKGKATSYFR